MLKRMWLVLTLALMTLAGQGGVAADKAADAAAVARTRKQVKVYDDIYKTAIVMITESYVNKPTDFGGGPFAVKWFEAIKKAGHHEARLVDASGDPSDPDNVAKDDFEKAAIKAIKSGKATYDEVVTRDGKQYLRAATAIPVVHKKCVMCHEHYKDVKPGEAIGSIMYIVPVE